MEPGTLRNISAQTGIRAAFYPIFTPKRDNFISFPIKRLDKFILKTKQQIAKTISQDYEIEAKSAAMNVTSTSVPRMNSVLRKSILKYEKLKKDREVNQDTTADKPEKLIIIHRRNPSKTIKNTFIFSDKKRFYIPNEFPHNITCNPRKLSLCETKPVKLSMTQVSVPSAPPRTTDGIIKIRNKVLEVISLKEAMRDRDWYIKSREIILKDIQLHLCYSNGISVIPPTEPFFTYKYFLGKGNNSKLIKDVFGCRWWWTRTHEENDAHLVWTQLKKKNFIESLPEHTGTAKAINHKFKDFKLASNLKYIEKSSNGMKIVKKVDTSCLGIELITGENGFTALTPLTLIDPIHIKCHNKLERNFSLANKKALFINLKALYTALGMDIFDVIPVTFHITQGEQDPNFAEFLDYYTSRGTSQSKSTNLWILKPGENTNQGKGITVCATIDEIKAEIKSNPHPRTGQHTYIIQQYIERPLLIHKRKFDIRCYALITSINGVLQGYFYNEGYLRTASKEYNKKNLANKFIHLTNDAIQKRGEDYGKYESGNKLTYSEFQRYIETYYSDSGFNFFNNILPSIRNIVKDTILAVFLKIDPKKRLHTFEIIGYDFLIDEDFKVWLIEANTNPCLELSSPCLARIIPAMVENAFRVAVDQIFPEPLSSKRLNAEMLTENKFELIFNEYVDGPELVTLLREKNTLDLILGEDKEIVDIAEFEDGETQQEA